MAVLRRWTIAPGNARTALWPTLANPSVPWVPTTQELAQIKALDGVEEVSCEGSQQFKVVIMAASVERLAQIIPLLRVQLQRIVERYHPV